MGGVLRLLSALVAALGPSAAAAQGVLSFFGASDVHFGHDVVAKDNTTTSSLALNKAAVAEMNALPLNDSWPAALGGGLVQTPVALVITGDLIDNGYTEGFEVRESATRPWTGHSRLLSRSLVALFALSLSYCTPFAGLFRRSTTLPPSTALLGPTGWSISLCTRAGATTRVNPAPYLSKVRRPWTDLD